MSSCPLRDDGWPVPEHVDCFNEIEYLRRRLEIADEVITAACNDLSPFAPHDQSTQVALVYAIDSYATFLGNQDDPSRRPYPVGPA